MPAETPLSHLRLRLRPAHSSTKLGRVLHSGKSIKELLSLVSSTYEVSLDRLDVAVEVLDKPDELKESEVRSSLHLILLYVIDIGDGAPVVAH